MKTIALFSSVATLAVGAFVLGLVFNSHAVAYYAIATSALFLLGFARDYAPRARRWEPSAVRHGAPLNVAQGQGLRLAA